MSDKHTASSPYAEFGRTITALRAKQKWSLREAAKAIGGIGHSRLQDFERAVDPHSAIPTRPTEDQIRRMARAYQVDPGPLLRLAGYSAIGRLDEWEELLIIKARKLDDSQRGVLMKYTDSLLSADPPN